MALWQCCGNGYHKVSFAKHDLGADAYLICPGPSLTDVSPNTFNVPGVITCCINKAHKHITPDIWIGMDRPECFDAQIWWAPYIKIARGGFQDCEVLGRPLRTFPNIYFADVEKAKPIDMLTRRAHDVKYVWSKNTFFVALHILIWMGAKTIYLVGNDLGGSKDYFDDTDLGDSLRAKNRKLYRWIGEQITCIARAAERNDIKIISATPYSPVNKSIDFIPLERAIEKSKKKLPNFELWGSGIHAHLGALCRWKKQEKLDDYGVIVGCDKEEEWMLPWWYKHFKANNPNMPLAFCDFGMSAAGKNFCKDKGILYECKGIDMQGDAGFTSSWFMKPFALLNSPFESSLWIDLDCKVLHNLDKYFDYIEPGKLAVSRDPCTPFCKTITDDPVTSGIVGATHGEELVSLWARRILEKHSELRGDQQALNMVIESGGADRVNIFPPHYQWLRLQGENDHAWTLHYTGPEGKKEIKRQSAASQDIETIFEEIENADGSGARLSKPDHSKEAPMPSSHHSCISDVLTEFRKAKPKSVLDIGIGFGKWGVLFREYADVICTSNPYKENWSTRIDGIEVHEKYLSPVHSYIYDNIYIGNATEVLDDLDSYDLAFMGDVLEHIEKTKAIHLLHDLCKKCKQVLLVVPLGEDWLRATPIADNPHEAHVSAWAQADLVPFGFKLIKEYKCGNRRIGFMMKQPDSKK